MPDERDELSELAQTCDRFIHSHGRRSAGEFLSEISPDTGIDRYGEGGVVGALEERIAGLLGMEDAVFCPSGTMAQQIVLRVHADRRGRRGIAFHPLCHLDWREGRGYERLHNLSAIQAGEPTRPLVLADLQAIAEPPAAVLLELPQRDLGGTLPGFDELVEMTGWVRDKGAAVHMDGARLWEAQPFYDRPLAEIAGQFDSVYVSFYKGLGALAGCCVASDRQTTGEVREWRRRHGGTLYSMWPNAASAMAALDKRLGLMGAYFERALQLAERLAEVPGVTVLPDPPMSPMMHLVFEATASEWEERFRALAADGICTWPRPWPGEVLPGRQRVELAIGDATMAFELDELVSVLARMAGSSS